MQKQDKLSAFGFRLHQSSNICTGKRHESWKYIRVSTFVQVKNMNYENTQNQRKCIKIDTMYNIVHCTLCLFWYIFFDLPQISTFFLYKRRKLGVIYIRRYFPDVLNCIITAPKLLYRFSRYKTRNWNKIYLLSDSHGRKHFFFIHFASIWSCSARYGGIILGENARNRRGKKKKKKKTRSQWQSA